MSELENLYHARHPWNLRRDYNGRVEETAGMLEIVDAEGDTIANVVADRDDNTVQLLIDAPVLLRLLQGVLGGNLPANEIAREYVRRYEKPGDLHVRGADYRDE